MFTPQRNLAAGHAAEKGSALLLAVVVLVVLGVIGIALLNLTQSERELGRSDLRNKQAFFIAEAGLEHARLALFDANGNKPFDDDLLAAAGGPSGNLKLEFDPDSLLPTFDNQGRLTGFSSGFTDDVPLVGVTPFGDGAYAAFLTNDPIDGTDTTSDANGRVILTAVGTAPGETMEVVQAIIETSAIWSMAPPAALTLLGPAPNYSPGTSNAKLYTGNDCPGGTPGYYVPAVGTIGPAATAHVRANQGKPTYSAGSLPPEQAIADLTDPGEPAVSSAVSKEWTDCLELRDMIEGIRAVADVVCTGPSCTLPPATPDRVVFVDGNWVLNNGAGILVVTGTLTMGGSRNWSGVILVVGEGNLHRAGGGGGVMMGSVVVANIAGPDGVYGNSDDCTDGAGNVAFGNATFNTSGGGNSTIGYCAGAIENATPVRMYDITEFLQR